VSDSAIAVCTPLKASQLAKLDAVQRKMMRRIVGWIRFDDEDWETTGQRMKARLDTAEQTSKISSWSSMRRWQQERLLHSVQDGSAPALVKLASDA